MPTKLQAFLAQTYPTGEALAPEVILELKRLEQEVLEASLRLQKAREEAGQACGHPPQALVWYEVESSRSGVVSMVRCRDCRKTLAEVLDPCIWGTDEFRAPL